MRFAPNPPRSLTSLAITLTELGDFDTALSSDRQAATIYVARYSIDGSDIRDSLQQAVNNLGIDLRDFLGRSEAEITNDHGRLPLTDDY